MSFSKTPFSIEKKEIEKEMKETLQEEFVSFSVKEFVAKEDMQEQLTSIESTISIENENFSEEHQISAKGKGIVDAMWSGLLDIKDLREHLDILGDLRFKKFDAKAMNEGTVTEKIQTGSPVRVSIQFSSSSRHHLEFTGKSHSINRASIDAFVNLLEFLTNASKSYQRTQELIEDAQERSLPDRAEKLKVFLSDLTSVVAFKE